MGCKKLTNRNNLKVLCRCIDYGKRYTDAYKDFKQIAKDNQLPPGPPNIKYIYAQEFMAGLQNTETVTDLTLLNNLSLAEWQNLNSDKDPGPPVCEPPFCDTGGNIDSPTLPENEVYFFHPDHLGSTSYITNIVGETVQFNSYLPFGESFVSQKRTSTISNYLFNSKEVDSETGLYYYGARYYNPKVSNWLSVDPIALYDPIDEVEHYLDGQHNGGYYNPRNLSVYGYTYQNPIVYVDPNGKQNYTTRILGGAQALGGAFEIAGAGALCTSGLGCVGSVFLAAHGLDNIQAGIRQMWTGESTNTFTMEALLKIGLTETEATVLEIIATAGVSGAGWTKLHNIRNFYNEGIRGLRKKGENILKNGGSYEDAARELVPERNKLKAAVRDKGDPFTKKAAETRNLKEYGDKLGPSADDLFQKNSAKYPKESSEQIWKRVYDGTFESNKTVNKVLGSQNP